jgi:hypothetical protein
MKRGFCGEVRGIFHIFRIFRIFCRGFPRPPLKLPFHPPVKGLGEMVGEKGEGPADAFLCNDLKISLSILIARRTESVTQANGILSSRLVIIRVRIYIKNVKRGGRMRWK